MDAYLRTEGNGDEENDEIATTTVDAKTEDVEEDASRGGNGKDVRDGSATAERPDERTRFSRRRSVLRGGSPARLSAKRKRSLSINAILDKKLKLMREEIAAEIHAVRVGTDKKLSFLHENIVQETTRSPSRSVLDGTISWLKDRGLVVLLTLGVVDPTLISRSVLALNSFFNIGSLPF